MDYKNKFYNLLKKYAGDINKATPVELRSAVQAYPRSPNAAYLDAKRRFHVWQKLNI